MSTNLGTPVQRRRRRRPRGKANAASKPAPAPKAAEVIAEARAPELDASPDEPLSPAEVARMKATLRFLREHRNTLKLKVNAAEDLLLNGRREPTHRGLCRHLLSKLDRARVLSASERLSPREATELLAGIVRFAPEIPYVIRFLQCVKATSDRRETALALTRALEQLDFRETSPAQLRDLLLLVVEVFPAEQLPIFVFSLLSREAFRAAFDRSSDRADEVWPSALAELLLPLRALHAWFERRRHAPRRQPEARKLSLGAVHAGALLLLGAGAENVLELPEKLRWPLFELGCAALPAAPAGELAAGALASLLERLGQARPNHPHPALLLGAAALRSGREPLARRVLEAARGAEALPEEGKRWLAALSGERVGSVALSNRGAGALPRDRFVRGFHLPSQSEVLVRFGEPELLRELSERWRRARVPGIAALLELGADPAERAHLVAAWPGPPLPVRLKRNAGRRAVAAFCVEACLLLRALAGLGFALPDAALQRFNVDAAERLWLSDLFGIHELEPPRAMNQAAALARAVCIEAFASLELDEMPSSLRAALEGAPDLSALIDALDG